MEFVGGGTMAKIVKRCPSCGEVKALEEYNRNKTNKDGAASEYKI